MGAQSCAVRGTSDQHQKKIQNNKIKSLHTKQLRYVT